MSEVEESFGKNVIPREEQKTLNPIPAENDLFCQSDFRMKAVATALDGNIALLAGLMRGEGRGGEGGGRRAEGGSTHVFQISACRLPTSPTRLDSPLSPVSPSPPSPFRLPPASN